MTLEQPSAQRPVPVRLCDLALDVRMRAARHIIRHGADPEGVFAAALAPSGRVYFVAEDARPLIEAYAA